MDAWEVLLQNYPATPDARNFSKAVQTTREVFKHDLADFEIDRILDTLLFSPIDLLTTVSSKYTNDAWSISIIESFKLLTEIITSHADSIRDHCENIEKICLLPHSSEIQRQSLTCLERVARVWGSSRPTRHIDELERGTTCMTQLALLVGTISEYHPEIIQEEVTRIWRIYLKLLESNKKTDTFVQAIFQGLCGLFKNFGVDLPISELAAFYNTMVGYIDTSKCEEVCLTMLEKYAALFAERVSGDVSTRGKVWSMLGRRDGAAGALRNLYTLVGHDNLKDVLEREVKPRATSKGIIKSAALRVLSHLKDRGFDSGDLTLYANVQALEFDLRCGEVSYDAADTISWYIESHLPDCDKLLQTALLFYENIPMSKRKDILAAMRRSKSTVRAEAVAFLASESCQPLDGSTDSIDRYMDIWRGLFAEDAGSTSRLILEDFINHVIFVIEVFLEEDCEELPEKLSSLLTLTSHILNLPAVEASEHTSVLLPLLGRCCRSLPPTAALLNATAAALRHRDEETAGSVDCQFQDIQVDRCRDEAVLCASCILLLLVPTTKTNCSNVLKALQILFSRNDAEPKMLSLGIKKLEDLLIECKHLLKDKDIDQAIHLVENLRSRKDLTGKDARVLHRDAVMFLGKYSRKLDVNEESYVNTIVSKLKDSLCLKIPNLDEGVTYKINLQELLQLAIVHEDPDALHQLLKIMCVNLSSGSRTTDSAGALLVVSLALCRCHARGCAVDTSGLQRAMMFCNEPQDIRHLLTFISEERSPGVRKMLSDALEALLVSGSDDLVRTVAERACVTMKSNDSTSRRAGLDMAEILATSLKENHALTKELLPSILEIIPRTNELEAISTFDVNSKLFLDKIALFDREIIERLKENIIVGLTQDCIKDNDVKTFKVITKKCLMFVKDIADVQIIDYSSIIKMCIDICDRDDVDFDKCVFLLASLKNVIDVPSSFYSSILHNNNILDGVYNLCINYDNLEIVSLEAILIFLKEYAETLLELNYKKTLEILDDIIKTMPPRYVIYEEKNISDCLVVYKEILKKLPQATLNSFEEWCNNLPLREMTVCLEKNHIISTHSAIVEALKIFLNITEYKATVLNELKRWPTLILKLFIDGISNKDMPFLTDCLTVAVRFLTAADIKRLISEGQVSIGDTEFIGVKFCTKFMKAFLYKFLEQPYILLDENMKGCVIILDDIVNYCMKKKFADEIYDRVLDLVDMVWTTYANVTSDHQKIKLLYNMSSLPKKLDVESHPLRWVARQLKSEHTSVEDKTRLVSVLPSGEEFSECYSAFAASCLCSSLAGSDRSEQAALRAALDALAAQRPRRLLAHVAALAHTDEAVRGWWDEAMSSCAASLARCERPELYNDLYDMTWDGLSRGVCDRLMVPLLRYSTPSFCEKFFSTKLTALLKIISSKPREVAANRHYHKCIVDHTRALTMLQVACEKVPIASIESPKSLLYKDIENPTFKHLTKVLCSLCMKLRKDVCPPGADEALQKSFWLYQCAMYKCLSAAICKVQQLEKFYGVLFNEEAWLKIVRPQDTYALPIIKKRLKTRLSVSIEVPPSGSGVSSLSRTSARTRMFLRTLSEHPLQYDLFDNEDDQVKVQEVQMSVSEVNHHECAGTLTALVSQAAALAAAHWRTELAAALAGPAGTLLAQVICNCKEELTSHASELRPALLSYIARTPRVENGKKLLNGLHIDILETLILWRDDPEIPESSTDNLNLTIEYLICTTIVHDDNWFLTLIDKCLELYGQFVSVQWKVFEDHLKDRNLMSAKICLHIIKRLTKHKIHMPELIPALLKYDLQNWLRELKISEAFGEALAYESDRDRTTYIVAFRQLLKRARQNKQIEGYIKMLYYAQNGSPDVCDVEDFRFVTDQTPKLPGRLKNKCILILAGYIGKRKADEHISTMFETIELSELIENKDNSDVLVLIKNGLGLMDETLKRRVVRQASETCYHSSSKVRQHAYLLMVEAFSELFKSKDGEPSNKRNKKMFTDVISAIDSTDPYTRTVMYCVGSGAVDTEVNGVLLGVAKVLVKDLRSRLAECLLTCLYLPKTVDMSACVPLLELVFSELRSKDSYRSAKLRDEPLQDIQSSAGPSKLVTRSRTYQGTFTSYRSTRNVRSRPLDEDTTKYSLDVQVTIDSVLDTFLKFAKKNPEVARALTVQVFKAIRESPDRGFDLDAAAAKQLVAMLGTPTEVTPLLVELARIVIDKQTNSFETVVKELKRLVYRSEGDDIVKCLQEDLEIRNIGLNHFVLGTEIDDADVPMESDMKRFVLEDLVSCFGLLSNWEDLTVQQRKNIESTGLPAVWPSLDEFKTQLKCYTVSGSTNTWFDKMVATYRNECKRESARWLRETDKWPYRHFDASAVIEAVSWTDSGEWPCEIRKRDCLLEWAARLTIRVTHASDTDEDFEYRPFLSHELLWCARANEMELYRPVLECYDRNLMLILDENDKLPWLHQKLLALRGLGLKRNDSDMLKEALNIAESTSGAVNTFDTIGIYKLIILLNRDLNTISTEKLQSIMSKINKRDAVSSKNKRVLLSMYEFAITYYDGLWSEDSSTQIQVVNNLTHTFHCMMDSNLGPNDVHLAVLFNRLEGYRGRLESNIAKKLLDVFECNFENLDDFSHDHIKSCLHLFPNDVLSRYKLKEQLEKDNINKYKLYLDLLRDARYSLLQYCDGLMMAAKDNDDIAWSEIFQRINRMLDNPHAGSDYQILVKYKDILQRIQDYHTSDMNTKVEVLTEVRRELRGHDNRTLRISQLCPSLTRPLELEKDGCIERLLSLGRLKVVKFHEQVSVFVGSIRRPALFSVVLADGSSRRFLHKAGEPLRRDAAAMRVARASPAACTLYTVTPLSEDSGIIQYIEDQVMLRSLITDKYNLDEISSSVRRPADGELILTSSTQPFELLCQKIPAYALRSAIEYHSSSLQDFVAKKRKFQDTLASTTVLTWMLGLGDRHLENILYLVSDGGVCCVDWGALFQFGALELPPARLTRNMLAVCDKQVFESRLQQLVKTLRETHNLLTTYIKMSFKWNTDFEDKFPYIEGLLSGSQLSHQVTSSVIAASNKPKKEKYQELLHQVFEEFDEKEEYSVVEQVTNLLRHCTDTRILNVTRAGWEPWV